MLTLKNKLNVWPLVIVLYLAITGLLCVFSAQLYIGESPNPFIGLICCGIIFGIYTLNRYTDSREDFANDMAKYVYFKSRRFLFFLGIAAIAFSFLALLLFEKLNYYHIILFALGLGYSFQIVPWFGPQKKIAFYRLKEIPLVKNLVVAMAWGLSIFMIPIRFSENDVRMSAPSFVLCIGCMVLVLNNTLFGDVRDVRGDFFAKNRTLPVLLGPRNCLFLLAAIDLLWLSVLFLLYRYGVINSGHLGFLTLICLYPVTYIVPCLLKTASENVIAFLSESDLLLFAIGLFLLSLSQKAL